MLEQSKSAFPWKLEYAILKESLQIGGRKEGLEFVLEVQANVERVAERLREKEESLREDLGAGAPYMQSGASPRIYLDGYIGALRDALNLLTRGTTGPQGGTTQEQPYAVGPGSPLPEAQRTIQTEIAVAGGKSDAFAFALTCQGSLAVLMSELQRAQSEVPPADAGGEEPLRSEATDRVYQEAYVAALREAIELIARITVQHPPEGTA